MMARLQDSLTYNLAAKRPWLGLLGFPIALVFAVGGITAPRFLAEPDYIAVRATCFLLAAAVALVAILVLTVRQGVRVDRRQGRVTTWNGFTFAPRRRAMPLDAFTVVEIHRTAILRRRGHVSVFFSVNLAGPHERVTVWMDEDPAEARAAAEELSVFAGLPLQSWADMPVYREDGTPVEARSPQTLHTTTGDLAADAGEAHTFPETPAGCRIRMRREGDAYVFELPTVRRSVLMSFVVALLAIGAAGVIAAWIDQQLEPDDPLVARAAVLALPAALAALLPPFILARGFNRRRQEECLHITPLALHGVVRQCWTRSEGEAPLERVEEFGYTPMAAAFAQTMPAHGTLRSPALLARTDHTTLYLGRGLTREEQVWLHDALRYLMAQAALARRNG